jgi:hypothetical protein
LFRLLKGLVCGYGWVKIHKGLSRFAGVVGGCELNLRMNGYGAGFFGGRVSNV